MNRLHDKEYETYSREAYLMNTYDNKRLFQGIESIEMVCTPKDYNRIAQEMRQLGCNLIEKDAERLTIASGDISITIEPSNSEPFSHITKIYCRLNDPDNSTTRFGNLAITNRGMTSVWAFESPIKN